MAILTELETWAKELGNTRCVLETGTMLPEAIRFYEKLGFTVFGGDEKMNYLIMKNESSLIGLFQGMFENNIITFNKLIFSLNNEVFFIEKFNASYLFISFDHLYTKY